MILLLLLLLLFMDLQFSVFVLSFYVSLRLEELKCCFISGYFLFSHFSSIFYVFSESLVPYSSSSSFYPVSLSLLASKWSTFLSLTETFKQMFAFMHSSSTLAANIRFWISYPLVLIMKSRYFSSVSKAISRNPRFV